LEWSHLAKHVIEEKTKVTGRRERIGTQLLDDLKETRGYWKLKEDALTFTLWELALEEAMDML